MNQNQLVVKSESGTIHHINKELFFKYCLSILQDTEETDEPLQLMLSDGIIKLIDEYISKSDNLDYQIPKPIPSFELTKILSQYDIDFISQFDLEFILKLIKAASYLQFEHLEQVCNAYIAAQALSRVVKEFTQKEYTYTKISY